MYIKKLLLKISKLLVVVFLYWGRYSLLLEIQVKRRIFFIIRKKNIISKVIIL